jgi:dUTP pyrophosphatase
MDNYTKLLNEVSKKMSSEVNSMDESFDLNAILNNMTEELNTIVGGVGEDEKLTLKYINESSNKGPEYIYEGDSGFDLRANNDEDITIDSLERYAVPTGLYFEIPKGYELQVRPRSGMAFKHGISVLNTPGTVDQGYRGEVKVILVNLSKNSYTIKKGERIAQAVITPVLTKNTLELVEVKEVTDSDRKDGKFGSTGTI